MKLTGKENKVLRTHVDQIHSFIGKTWRYPNLSTQLDSSFNNLSKESKTRVLYKLKKHFRNHGCYVYEVKERSNGFIFSIKKGNFNYNRKS